jgi:hypothetical protein
MERSYNNIRELLQKRLLLDEEPKAKALIDKLHDVKCRGYFSKNEFLEICKWKDPRELRRSYWQANTESEVIAVSTQVFATSDEHERIVRLDSLRGVAVPIASAILTVTDPQAYGVIDKRVWQLLYLYGEVDHSPEGIGLSVRHWEDYLPKLRQWASELGVGVRTVERSLFEYHKHPQPCKTNQAV